MKRFVIALLIGVVAVIVFLSGAVLGEHFRLKAKLDIVLNRSSACSILELPAVYMNRLQRHRAGSYVRANLQLIKRDPAGFELWSTPDGPWWIPAGNVGTLTLVLAEQRCDIYGTGGVKLHPGDIVLDCGAHIGTFTRKALNSGAKVVIAVEPAPENVECLRRNFVQEIASGRVTIYAKGVWDRDDVLKLSAAGSAEHAIIDDRGSGENRASITVPLTTIDTLTKDLRLARVDFIKMDIEGAEERALTGAQGVLSAYRPRLAIAGYHNREDYKSIDRVVRKASASYRMQCGPCYSARGIRPEALFFQ